jgi:hypothetical protein
MRFALDMALFTGLSIVKVLMQASQDSPPDRIFDWLYTQLSIARNSGGCTYQGVNYVIDMDHPKKPLVRQDVLTAELKAKKQAVSNRTKADGQKARDAQRGLI